jgi:hypothetical protein
MFIIFDEYYKSNFILGFYNSSQNDNYRNYSHITIKNNKFIILNIEPFDYYNLWKFDNRNYICERLYNNKLCIIVKHRDNFDENLKITIVDINVDFYKCIIKEYVKQSMSSFLLYKDIILLNNSIKINDILILFNNT